jgi:hypothetical protein
MYFRHTAHREIGVSGEFFAPFPLMPENVLSQALTVPQKFD